MKDPRSGCTYLLSAAKPSQFPPATLPEVAVSGRSNVGKSSLLNLLVGQNNLAKVSKTPGKTRTLNFFDVGSDWRLVDLPGYGYARLSQAETARWGKVIDAYLTERSTLAAVIQLIDSRHDPSRMDLEMIEWLRETQIPVIIALTKVDKLGKNPRRTIANSFRRQWLEGASWPVVCTSALERTGREDLLAALRGLLPEKAP
jgi:GTP-binding protein